MIISYAVLQLKPVLIDLIEKVWAGSLMPPQKVTMVMKTAKNKKIG
jgi:hypothetical protein